MSPRSPRPFLADLRRLEADLPVPVPARLRFLQELEYDLEELRSGLVARGMSADEARRRALEALLPDPGTVGELGRVHTPLYRRLTASLDDRLLRRVERGALALLTAGVLVAQAVALLQADLLEDPSPFLLPVLVTGALLSALCAAKAFQLWVKGDHRDPPRGLGTILGLSVLALLTGFVGVILDTQVLAATLEGAPGLAGALGPAWLVRECALLAVSILVAVGGGLAWFTLSWWVAGIAGARHEILETDPAKEAIP